MVNSKLLKLRAKNMGVRQLDLAEALGIKQSSVNLKINNQRPMTVDEAEIIAELLNISDEMFGVYFFSHTRKTIRVKVRKCIRRSYIWEK